MRQIEPIPMLSEPPTVDCFAPVGSLYMTFFSNANRHCYQTESLPYLTKHNNDIHVFEFYLCSTITRMHKHIISAVVYNRFLFHASIAFKVATDKHTGGYAARICLSCHQLPHFPFILCEWICAITMLTLTPFRPIRIFALGNKMIF